MGPSSSDWARVVTVRPVATHVVLELEQQGERVTGRGVELQAEGELVLVPGLERPGHPAHEAVDGVLAFGLVERGLGPHARRTRSGRRPGGWARGRVPGPGPSGTTRRSRIRRSPGSRPRNRRAGWRRPRRRRPPGCRARCATAAPWARRSEILGVRAVMRGELKQTRASAWVRGRTRRAVKAR